MAQRKARNKRILLMTNFGAPLYPKTITEAVQDDKRDKNVSELLDDIYEKIRDGQGIPGEGVPAGGSTGQILAKKTDNDYDTEWKDYTPGGSESGEDGKTPIIGAITAQSVSESELPSFSLTHTSNDTLGNPIYTGLIRIPKGKDGINGEDGENGKTPILEIGTVTTLAPGSQATVDIISSGVDASGNPKYTINFGIPRGTNGDSGSGGSTDWSEITGKPSWIGPTKPTYTAAEVGALPTSHNTDVSAHLDIRTNMSNIDARVGVLENLLPEPFEMIEIEAGDNVTITENGDKLKISATTSFDGDLPDDIFLKNIYFQHMINCEAPVTTTFGDINFPSALKRGERTNVYVQANYSGRFAIYATYADSSYDMILDETDNFATGHEYVVNIPLTVDRISFRTFLAGIIVLDLHFFEINTKHRVIKTPWWGNEILTYGDSIVAINNETRRPPYLTGDNPLTSWGGIVASTLGLNRVYGRGVGGQSYIVNPDTWYANADGEYVARPPTLQPAGTTVLPGPFCSWGRITTMVPANYDGIILIMGGVNDWGRNAEIESTLPAFISGNSVDVNWASSGSYLGGDYDISKFKGAVASTIMKMQIVAPNANIILATPLSGRTNETGNAYDLAKNTIGKTMLDYSNAVKEVALLMSIPLIDVFATTGINQITRDFYLSDVVHPYTLLGKRALARAVISGLTCIYPNFWNI